MRPEPCALSSQKGEVSINDDAIADVVGNIRFSSITYRLFKLPGQLEPDCEDYGQLVTYRVSAGFRTEP